MHLTEILAAVDAQTDHRSQQVSRLHGAPGEVSVRVFSVRNVGDDRPRARRTWMLGVAAGGVAVTLATLAIRAPALHAKGGEAPRESAFATTDTAIPDDRVLLEQLTKAIDLRRREDFDR